ncbi:MAG: hypothetical protein KJ052_10840, partial [Candidatus Hydrogenedentes bacterium]|nr:hypothetical protein [Candidatus Hydrogenedentota bacterium]
TLTSPVFTIDRRFINLLVGGGNHPDRTEARLVVDGEVVRTARGKNNEKLTWLTWTVRELEGKEARIEIIDRESGGWGHINVDHIEFADVPREGGLGKLEELPDYGAMALTLNGPSDSEIARSAAERLMLDAIAMGETMADVPDAPAGIAATPRTKLAPGDTVTAAFAVTWHFPNREHGHFYATRFDNARDVAHYLFDNHERLTADTCLWHDTYYDSSLPYYLLDRLFVPLSTLSTGVCQWWANGRFYAFEGVVCCEGTCTHVWNYAHGHARLFPELARSIREMQDFNSDGGGFHPDTGLVGFRSNDAYAADGQCGTILKACREHQMSPDSAFLERNWPHIRKALEYSMSRDANDDGLIEDSQHNTFDINFEGSNTFVGSLYLAALRAGEAMAREMGDTAFADRCRRVFESGQRKSIERLWDGEYFIQEVDIEQHPKHQYGRGCLSDQVFGQGWAHQLNLGYIYPKENVDSALQAIWKYNWAPDVTRQQEAHGPGRPFVMPGEAGMFTCTWPKSPYLDEGVLYRNEVWTGIEYQVAGHMIWEGMIEEALATVRAVHDRYHPLLRNPWNEVECGDHYARALASWGVYSALSGFRYHGPMKMLAFAPKLGGEIFRTAFVTAEGWGTYELNESDGAPSTVLTLKKGRLPLSTLLLGSGRTKLPRIVIETSPGGQVHEFNASLDEDGAIAIAFPPDFVLNEGEVLRVSESNP